MVFIKFIRRWHFDMWAGNLKLSCTFLDRDFRIDKIVEVFGEDPPKDAVRIAIPVPISKRELFDRIQALRYELKRQGKLPRE